MSGQASSVEYQPNVATTDAIAFGQFDLRDDASEGADFFGLPHRDLPSPSMSEHVAAIRLGPEVIHSDAVLLFAPMVDHQPVGNGSVDFFVGGSMSALAISGLPVSLWCEEALPDVTWGIESPVHFGPRLRQTSVMAEEKTEGLPRNPSSCGMSPGSDGRGISAPTFAKAVIHNYVEFTTVGGV